MLSPAYAQYSVRAKARRAQARGSAAGPASSKHIKVLEAAGLVVRGQRAQYRPCTLDPAPLEEISAWAEQYRPVWEARFDRMDGYLMQLRSQRKTDEHDD